jgi:ubiquinone/menaquinone biosynthesis C-methylase UbiE
MHNSLSFDRAAGYYDQTRSLPGPIVRQGVRAILDISGAAARVLDVGTGTGRISIPLLEHGADLVGCDLSSEMLQRLQEKLPPARILQADASRMPFPTGHFDALLTVHVLHLIAPWQEALQEFKRVLRPGGIYLNVRTYERAGFSIREQMRNFWREWVEAQGVKIHQPGVRDHQVFLKELKSLGVRLEEVEVVRYSLSYTLREELGRYNARVYSDAWQLPDEVHAASMRELRNWVDREYGDLDQQREDEVRFVIDVARFGEKEEGYGRGG